MPFFQNTLNIKIGYQSNMVSELVLQLLYDLASSYAAVYVVLANVDRSVFSSRSAHCDVIRDLHENFVTVQHLLRQPAVKGCSWHPSKTFSTHRVRCYSRLRQQNVDVVECLLSPSETNTGNSNITKKPPAEPMTTQHPQCLQTITNCGGRRAQALACTAKRFYPWIECRPNQSFI